MQYEVMEVRNKMINSFKTAKKQRQVAQTFLKTVTE
jgi:hypothetical protein